jgi:hypothetical protein
MIQDIDVFEHPVVVGYPPGAGGNRLRRALLGVPWAIEARQDLHRIDELKKYSQDIGYPKLPLADCNEVEDPKFNKFPILITHGMNSVVLQRIFPHRKIVKVYCDLYQCFRRHWLVFAKAQMIDYIKKNRLNSLSAQDIQRYIQWSLDYYRDNLDFKQHHSIYIEPNGGEFSEFMIKEFQEFENSDFERAWRTVAKMPQYASLANMDLIKTAKTLSQNLDSGAARA